MADVKLQATNSMITDVFLACEGTPILLVVPYQKSPGARRGISYIYFRVGLKKLKLKAEAPSTEPVP